MKKVRFFLVILVFLAQLAQAQSDTASKKFRFDFHGFVNPHFYADSREVVGGREDMMLFYPKPVNLDANGNDLNDGWQANMLAITARMGLRINGPDALGAKTSAYVEGDFTGSTNATINNLRLRHAYIDLLWKNQGLLIGQYWYPMQIHEVMPFTNPLNMGAPFALYARQPQVRYKYHLLGLEAVAAASWQLDNMSQGELNGQHISSTAFARHSLIPELTAQLRYNGDKIFFGAAVNAKTIQPQIPVTTLDKRLHTSLSYTLFGRIKLGPVTIKAQTLLNNSLYEGCSLGGYAFLYGSSMSHAFVRDWHFNTVWLDISRNRGRLRPGLFAGYAKRGYIVESTEDFLHIETLGRGDNISYLWRIQPRMTFYLSDVMFCTAEAEYTYANYLTNIGPDPVGNLRLSLTLQYNF
ncbi:MAG: hypothetical protein J6T88_08510 [Bacteroidales bacterium]|nr:hypothetical protein [Bacteroidales bacterium]